MNVLARLVRAVLPMSLRERMNRLPTVRWLRLWVRTYRVIRPAVRRQLAGDARAVAGASTDGPRVLVPLLQLNHYQAFQILITAKALELRGASVKVLICDSVLDGCEIKNIRDTQAAPCLTCRFNRNHLLDLYGLDCVKLSEVVDSRRRSELRREADALAARYPERELIDGVDVVRMTNESVTRHCYGAVPDEGSAELRQLRARYLYTALVGLEAAKRMHREWQPTTLVNDMGVYCDWAPYAEYFRGQGVRYNVVSLSPFVLNAVMLNFDELYSGTERFDRWRGTRRDTWLTAAENTELDALLEQRFSGSGEIERMYAFFDAAASRWTDGIDRSKRNVFLFPNVFWDIGLAYAHALFPDVVSWVLASIEALANRPDTHLYIKPHPAEVYGTGTSRRSITDIIHERYPTLPDNVSIIAPELKVTTYELFPFIDLGVVYNGTLGLELLLRDIPVVVGGAAPYGGHGMATEPATRAEYDAALRGQRAPVRPGPELVRLFAYFYFIKAQLPWRLTPRAYADDFKGYTFESLEGIAPGADPALDHLCACILREERPVIEGWA